VLLLISGIAGLSNNATISYTTFTSIIAANNF